ncbi:RNA polymerase sigma factor [Paenibacillus glycanilyticus]|uniref:RNA polymerase sigma factor n=1 Tax=Paenibacillus glycanilyticus TaxID=126569 RepID=UPI00203B5635|nr:RNA polymerase sigma factor [Paenibacillus glycanilyticus]MCM3630232.1 RNA polymerase sigma factor [Paenibacillus glycanilyticus]
MNQSMRSKTADIELWIRLVKEGNKDAYQHVIEFYQLPLYRYVYQLLHDREESEDAVQDVFLQVFRNMDKYSRQISFTSWLYKIAYHHCLNLIRKRNGLLSRLHLFRREAVTTDYDSSLRVDEILRGLSLEEKQIVLLRVVEELTFEEISLILDCKAATVRKRYERTRVKMQRNYVNEEGKSNGKEPWASISTER